MSDPNPSVVTTDPVPETDASAEAFVRGAGAGVVSGTTRRTVLRAAGLVALAGSSAAALAACGSSESATPATSTAPSGSAPASSGAAGEATVSKAEVPVGGGFILPNADYVVTQPEAGTYKAFSSKCTHMGCKVALITNKEIVCNCHGSHYSITDGSVLAGPAPKPLPAAKATVSGNEIVVSG